jgi:hypothetical protein
MMVWRLSGRDVTKFNAIYAMSALEFLNYAQLTTDILRAEEMERARQRHQAQAAAGGAR